MQIKLTLRTRKIDSYFSGTIKKGYFPCDGKELFYVVCASYAGGGVPILNVIDLKAETEKGIIEQVKAFAKKYKLILKFPTHINIGGVHYKPKALYQGMEVEILDCFGGAGEKCKIEMPIGGVKVVDTEILELTEDNDSY